MSGNQTAAEEHGEGELTELHDGYLRTEYLMKNAWQGRKEL